MLARRGAVTFASDVADQSVELMQAGGVVSVRRRLLLSIVMGMVQRESAGRRGG